MASLDQKREAFRKYLESAGAIDCLSKALIRLYQEDHKPEDACKFIRQVLCENCPTDEQVAESMEELAAARKRIQQLERENRGLVLNVRRTASETNLALDTGLQEMAEDEGCCSLLKTHLTQELLDKLREMKTPEYKSTLLDCVQSGLKNRDSHIGLYAADPMAYSVFADLFNPLIEEYHTGFGADDKQAELSWGEPTELENVDPEGQYVISTRVRCARSVEGFPFHPRMQEEQYEAIYEKVQAALQDLPEELQGELHLLETLDASKKLELTEGHYLFKECDRFLEEAKANRFFPAGRAIFLNEAKTFVVWVNEEDHLRIISMQDGADIAQVYQRFITALNTLDKHIPFQRDERLGYLTFCPTNLGTAIRASVHIRLPKLSSDKARMEEAATTNKLQIRGVHGEHTDAGDGILDVSNKRRLGLTEFEAIKEMVDGVKALIELEKKLESGDGEAANEAGGEAETAE